MTVSVDLQIEGTSYNDFTNGNVTKTIGEDNTSSNSTFVFGNERGKYSNIFSVGNEIQVDTNGSTIFVGVIEDINILGKGDNSKITLMGRDFTAVLQDITIPPEVYTNQEVSDIIDDFIGKYAENITYNKQATATTLTRISFNHTSIFEALQRLGELTGYYFYVDTSKELQFVQRNTVNSGKTFDTTNVLKTKWKTTRKEMINQVYVYGDKQLIGEKETFASAGSVDTGSVFTLAEKPHNTEITVDAVQKRGAVFEMVSEAASGTDYLVNFHDKQIIFVSGIEAGDQVPSSGTSIVVIYDRAAPIIKFGRDRNSIDSYGVKEKIVIDKNIKDPTEASDEVRKILSGNKNPKTEGTLNLKGAFNLEPGESCIVNIPFDNINNITYNMLQITYDFTPNNLFSDRVLSVKLNKRIRNINDTIKQALEDIKKLQAGDIDTSDGLTRLEFATGSTAAKLNWKVYTHGLGSGFAFDTTTNSDFDDSGLFFDGSRAFTLVQSGGVWT